MGFWVRVNVCKVLLLRGLGCFCVVRVSELDVSVLNKKVSFLYQYPGVFGYSKEYDLLEGHFRCEGKGILSQ